MANSKRAKRPRVKTNKEAAHDESALKAILEKHLMLAEPGLAETILGLGQGTILEAAADLLHESGTHQSLLHRLCPSALTTYTQILLAVGIEMAVSLRQTEDQLEHKPRVVAGNVLIN